MTIDERNPLLIAVREQLDADLEQSHRCQCGDHDMLATATPGVVVCRVCRILGVCLWCGYNLPPGACISVCAHHVGAVQAQRQATRHRPRTSTARRSEQSRREENPPDDV